MNSNESKAALLGIPFGTANNKLKKSILFNFAKRLNEDICYRCGIKIENIDDFSIEHKVAWGSSSSPIEYFYDLNNIAFSHIYCNIRAQPSRKLYATNKERIKAATDSKRNNPIRYQKFLKYKRDWYHKKQGHLSQQVEETISKVVK